jgi:hypothetical protein
MISRRGFLVGAGAGVGAALAPSLIARLAHSEPRRAPLRLLLVHKPVGTSPDHYDCAGNGRDFTLSEILQPFAELREQMVIVDGLENRKQANTPGEDHANGMTTFLTGGIPFRARGSEILMTERASADQLFAQDARFVGGTPIKSLQLTADDRGHQFLLRIPSHAGRGIPLPPVESPLAVFARVFGTLADRAVTPEEAKRLRDRKQSVLDFTRADLARVKQRMGNTEHARIERHFTAIREVEQVVHRVADLDPLPLQRQMAAVEALRDESRDRHHAAIGRAHFDLLRVAFQCDLVRVASFTWGSWITNVGNYVPGVEGRSHHDLSHLPKLVEQAIVHRWYNEQLAAFLKALRATPDIDGRSVLDNTLVVSWTEMRLGNHTFDNTPIQLFGGAGGRLAGGRIVRYPGYSTNDMWRTIINATLDGREVFGDANKNSGRLARLFDDAALDDATANPNEASP